MRNITLRVAAFAVFLSLLATNVAHAASPQDKTFLVNALQEAIDLRSLADLAAQKSRDPRVRAFAKSVSASADAAGRPLIAIAQRERVKQPGTLSIRATDQYSRITAQSGRSTEHEFLEDVSIDARISEDDFTSEAQSGSDSKLRRLAASDGTNLERTARQADALDRSLH